MDVASIDHPELNTAETFIFMNKISKNDVFPQIEFFLSFQVESMLEIHIFK